VAESSVTALVYYKLGLFVAESKDIFSTLIPSVLIGIPAGAYVIRRLEPETFRRICMSFDAWVVGFGFSRVLIDLKLMQSLWAYSVMAVTILIDVYLLYVFFTTRHATSRRSQLQLASPMPGYRSSPTDRIRPDTLDRDPFGILGTLLGYVIAILGIAMLLYAIRQPP
jgi:small-conductance mechanosensitive channel